MNQQPILFLMLGYPGAGKTTTAEIISQLTGAVHLASDQIRLTLFPEPAFTPHEHETLYKAIDQQTEALLAQGKSVIYDANLNRFKHRQEKYDICKRTGAKSVLVWVQAAETTAKKRATEDGNNDPKRPFGNLKAKTFDRLVREIEPPTKNEVYITIDGTKVDSDYIKEKLDAASANQ